MLKDGMVKGIRFTKAKSNDSRIDFWDTSINMRFYKNYYSIIKL